MIFPQFSVRYSFATASAIRKCISGRRYDAVYLDHSQMFAYATLFDSSTKILMMAHDLQVQRFRRLFGRFASWMCAITERRFMTLPNVRVLTFSQKDAEIARREYAVLPITVHFYIDLCVKRSCSVKTGDYLVFFAAWSRRENCEGLRWFVRNVCPLLKSSIRFVVIGGGMPLELQLELKCRQNFEYRGFVDNPYPIIANAKALVAPLFKGAGVKVKVIESLAVGTKVIGTEVAFEGVPVEFSDAMLQCASANDFANVISSLRGSIDEKISLKGRFLANYCGETAGEKIAKVIRDWEQDAW